MMQRNGYILILTLMVISLSVVLVTFIATRGITFFPFARIERDREKAEMLAFGGVQLALSQLAGGQEEQKKPAAGTKEPAAMAQAENKEQQKATALLTTLLPILNRPQKIQFNKGRDGFEGVLNICVMSEEGKLNINEIYDFEKQKFVNEGQPQGDMKKMLQELFIRLEKLTGGKELFKGFEKFLKDRQYKVNDATQLLSIKEFSIVFRENVWYQPPEQTKDTTKKEQRPVYLTDLFTVWSGTAQVEPWLLSDSMRALLDLKRVEPQDKDEKESMKERLKKFKTQATWSSDWNTLLAPLYGKDFSKLPQGIDVLLRPTFGGATFSVLSYGVVGSITQKIVAIVERRESSSKERDARFDVIIKKLYWL